MNRITTQKRRVMCILIGLLTGLILLAACGSPPSSSIVAIPGFDGPLATANPEATPTHTPFSPLPQTETPLPPPPDTATPPPTPTSVDPWGDFAAPIEPSAIEIRRPVDPLDIPEDVVNIAVLGSDQRPNRYGFRTDVVMIVSLDPEAGTVTLFSIPRDLYVFIPGWRVDRINTAEPRGGPEVFADTILYNFGIEVDHWVRVNFSGFKTIVDLLGGIDVDVTAPLWDECGGIRWSYRAGTTYRMDGFEALCYVRMRRTRGGDFDRLRRQQEVMVALFNRVLTLDGLARVPELYDQFSGLVETDIEVEDLLDLIPLAAKVGSDPSQIQRVTIDTSMSSLWRVPYSGASVVLPDWEPIEALLQSTFETDPPSG